METPLISSFSVLCFRHRLICLPFPMVWYTLFVLVLLCFVFRLYALVKVAALRSIVLRYAGAPTATRVSFFLSFFRLFIWRCRFFRVFFDTISAFYLYGEYVYVLFFRMVFFLSYLVTTGWIFDVIVCDNSINQNVSGTLFT